MKKLFFGIILSLLSVLTFAQGHTNADACALAASQGRATQYQPVALATPQSRVGWEEVTVAGLGYSAGMCAKGHTTFDQDKWVFMGPNFKLAVKRKADGTLLDVRMWDCMNWIDINSIRIVPASVPLAQNSQPVASSTTTSSTDCANCDPVIVDRPVIVRNRILCQGADGNIAESVNGQCPISVPCATCRPSVSVPPSLPNSNLRYCRILTAPESQGGRILADFGLLDDNACAAAKQRWNSSRQGSLTPAAPFVAAGPTATQVQSFGGRQCRILTAPESQGGRILADFGLLDDNACAAAKQRWNSSRKT